MRPERLFCKKGCDSEEESLYLMFDDRKACRTEHCNKICIKEEQGDHKLWFSKIDLYCRVFVSRSLWPWPLPWILHLRVHLQNPWMKSYGMIILFLNRIKTFRDREKRSHKATAFKTVLPMFRFTMVKIQQSTIYSNIPSSSSHPPRSPLQNWSFYGADPSPSWNVWCLTPSFLRSCCKSSPSVLIHYSSFGYRDQKTCSFLLWAVDCILGLLSQEVVAQSCGPFCND